MPDNEIPYCTRAELQTAPPGLYVIADETPDPTPRAVWDMTADEMRMRVFTRRLARVRDADSPVSPRWVGRAIRAAEALDYIAQSGRADSFHADRVWTRADGKTVLEIED